MGKIQCIAKKVLEKVEVVGRSTSAVGRAVERVAIKLKDKIKRNGLAELVAYDRDALAQMGWVEEELQEDQEALLQH